MHFIAQIQKRKGRLHNGKSVSYTHLTYAEAYADALARAVELAKTRASVLAEASGQELGYVINIEEYGDRQEGRYVTSNLSMTSAPGAGAAAEAVMDMGVMPGEMEVTASIRIEFALLPKQ